MDSAEPLCIILNRIFPEVSYLALNAGISSWSKVKEAAFYTRLSQDEVIRTKCRLIADTLSYILSYQPYPKNSTNVANSQPKEKMAWWIRLRGVNHFNRSTGVGHALIVVERDDGEYLLIDSYIGCRGLTCRKISFNLLREQLATLEKKYDPELWFEVTGCQEKEIPDHVRVRATKYTYQDDVTSILDRFSELQEERPDLAYGHKND